MESTARKKTREQNELTGSEQEFISLTSAVVTGIQSASELRAGPTVPNIENAQFIDVVEEELQSSHQVEEMRQMQHKKGKKNSLLIAYVKGQEEAQQGLGNVASELGNITTAINRFCDIYEDILSKKQ
ncbi:hypothetical protein FQA39_LY15640 [Lamprigera yunnana]|nr:hypothetical protein FQA39_LY15640 [Lamprigera yunnana]